MADESTWGGTPLTRRSLFRGAGTAALWGTGAVTLASCARGGGLGDTGDSAEDAPAGEVTDTNPFGLAEDSSVEVVIFNGGYGVDYAEYTAEVMAELHPSVDIEVATSTQIGQELQPRFTGGNPPDMFNNSGSGSIALRTILEQVEDLTQLVEAPSYDGVPIKDTLYPGTIEAGTTGDTFAELPYVLSVFTPWYSASLFAENDWTPPRSWDEAIELGARAQEQDKYLFTWGKEAATYYLRLAMISAIKDGGHDVRRTVDRLEPNCWSHPALQAVFEALETCITSGYFMPGGAGTQFTAAQAQWSNAQDVLLYPAGSWIENEMADQTADGFEMTGFPAMMIDPDGGAMPYEAMYSTASTSFLVPSAAANAAGGLEFLRAMLSKEAAANFTEINRAITVVKDTVPDDAFGSTALASQSALIDAADENTFSWIYGIYGMDADHLVIWNSFLAGDTDVAGLTARMQEITDAIAEDDTIEKVEVE